MFFIAIKEYMECYRFEQENFEAGFLDDGVSATYIIHLEGNGRLDHVRVQLSQYHPTKIVYILFNKGYKKCSKNLREKVPPVDLVDAYKTVMEHADQHNYGNILVLEDDFIFDQKIVEPVHVDRITAFLKERGDTSMSYSLGCLPIFQIPTSYYHRYSLLKCGTHAVIYTKKFRKQAIRDIERADSFPLKEDWDIYTNSKFNQYMYYIPLCYQLFTDTENQRHWIYLPGITELALFYFKFFRMDTAPQLGFSILYYFSLFIFFIILCLLLFAVYWSAIYWEKSKLKNLIMKGYKKNFGVSKII